jgi:hypothetical protein
VRSGIRQRELRSRLNIVRFIFRLRRNRRLWKRGGVHKSFVAACGANLHVALHAIDHFDLFAALQFRLHVEIDERLVHPHAVFVRATTYANRGRGACLRSGGCDGREDESCGERLANHDASCGALWRRANAQKVKRVLRRMGLILARSPESVGWDDDRGTEVRRDLRRGGVPKRHPGKLR